MANDEPMSDERLAELGQQFTRKVFPNGASIEPTNAPVVRELLAEVERLRAREAALVAVVEKVWTLAVQSAYDDKWFIPHVHAAHELVNQARALLAATEPTDATTAERE